MTHWLWWFTDLAKRLRYTWKWTGAELEHGARVDLVTAWDIAGCIVDAHAITMGRWRKEKEGAR